MIKTQKTNGFFIHCLLVCLFITGFGALFSIQTVDAQSPETQESSKSAALQYGSPILYSDGIITSFTSHVTLTPRGDGEIEEHIIVYFPNARHGIFRWIPNKVILEDGSTLRQPIKNLDVSYRLLPKTATSNKLEEWEYEYETDTSEGGYLMIKIGDADVTLTGAVEYKISYTIKNLIRFLPDHQELYLNITGNGWELPIVSTAAIVIPVTGVSEKACYTGIAGSTADACTMLLTSSQFAVLTTKPLAPAEGLTIALKYPQGTFTGPTAAEKILTQILIFSPCLFPVLAFAVGFALWKKYGKDKPVFAIPPVFVPSQELKQAGFTTLKYLHDMHTSKLPVLAELIAIAEKGLITMSYENKKITLFVSDTQREKLLAYLETQPLYIQTMVATFTSDFSESTTINDLTSVYDDIALMNKHSAEAFNASAYIHQSSVQKRNVLIVFIVLSVILMVISFIIVSQGDDPAFLTWPAALLASTVILGFFAIFMLKRSVEGEQLYLDILGIKKYIQAAELKRLEFFNNPKKMIAHFEELLPYAIILGLDKQWTRTFGPILEQLEYQPSWFVSSMPLYHVWPGTYASMANSFSSISSKLATPPQSSSSGFGGGGFSGGGSGGGGGGSW